MMKNDKGIFIRDIKKLGGSYIIRVDPKIMKQLGLKEGETVKVTVEKFKL